ncbi:NDUS5 protein, partial [Campylorhamphus procurvoides]|nr:NDUS5 protein [Campylorhamphus procurvoides]
MPFWDLQKQLGIDVDSWLLRQSMPQPHRRAAVCHAFEREWVEGWCGFHICGAARTCPGDPLRAVTPPRCPCQAKRLRTILEQRDKMIKEGKYTPPDHHTGKDDNRP